MLPISLGPGSAHRLQVGEAEARDPLVAELVAVAEELVAAADGEHHRAVLDGLGEARALGRHHVLGDDPLVAVLAPADVDQVVGARVERLARPRGGVREADPAPLAAPPQEQDVAAVGVDVHLLGVQRDGAELHHGRSRTTTVEPR